MADLKYSIWIIKTPFGSFFIYLFHSFTYGIICEKGESFMDQEIINFKEEFPLKIRIQSISKSPIHYHEGITEIILPIRGEVKIKANFEEIVINEGDFFFINNKTIHSISSNDEAIVLFFYIRLEDFQKQFPYINHMFFRNRISGLLATRVKNFEEKNKQIANFRNLLIRIFLEDNSRNKYNSTIDRNIYKLVCKMTYEFDYLKLIKGDDEFISSYHLDRYHRIVKYIQENLANRIYLEAIESKEFLSKTYLSNYWKKLSAYTFNERVNFERVLRSEFLLYQRMTLSEISLQCGFSDIKYYYKNFQKWYGCMPLEYREKTSFYEENGYNYKSLSFNHISEDFHSYIDNFYDLKDDNEKPNYLSLLDKYLYLQSNHVRHSQNKDSRNSFVILEPFKYTTLEEKTKEILFDWATFDFFINLIIDHELNLQIKINSDYTKRDFLLDYINIFLKRIINRYGLEVVNKFQYIIDYKDGIALDNGQTINDIIRDIVGDVNISYYIEP